MFQLTKCFKYKQRYNFLLFTIATRNRLNILRVTCSTDNTSEVPGNHYREHNFFYRFALSRKNLTVSSKQ